MGCDNRLINDNNNILKKLLGTMLSFKKTTSEKGLYSRCLSILDPEPHLPPLHTVYLYTVYLFTQGREEGGRV
jgi:hypothetical protein